MARGAGRGVLCRVTSPARRLVSRKSVSVITRGGDRHVETRSSAFSEDETKGKEQLE
jgi:hypothetical protein